MMKLEMIEKEIIIDVEKSGRIGKILIDEVDLNVGNRIDELIERKVKLDNVMKVGRGEFERKGVEDGDGELNGLEIEELIMEDRMRGDIEGMNEIEGRRMRRKE